MLYTTSIVDQFINKNLAGKEVFYSNLCIIGSQNKYEHIRNSPNIHKRTNFIYYIRKLKCYYVFCEEKRCANRIKLMNYVYIEP